MVKAVKITNHLGEELYVDLSNYRETGFIVRSIEGLGPVKALINTSTLAGKDGAVFNSSKVEQRNIVFNMTLVPPDNGDDEESARIRCDRIFATKRMVTMDFLTESRYVTINGYVETNEQDIFRNRTDVQISVICPDPFFYRIDSNGMENISLDKVIPALHFPYPSWTIDTRRYHEYEQGTGSVIRIDLLSMITDDPFGEEVYIRFTNGFDIEELVTELELHCLNSDSEEIVLSGVILNNATFTPMNVPAGMTCKFRYAGDEDFAIWVLEDIENEVGSYYSDEEVSVYYDGETDVGINIIIDCGSDTDGMTYIKIHKTNTNEVLEIDVDKIQSATGEALKAGDRITISTERGMKKAILNRSGVDYNIINCIARDSDWIRLDHGDNRFIYICDSGQNSISVRFEYSTVYIGV